MDRILEPEIMASKAEAAAYARADFADSNQFTAGAPVGHAWNEARTRALYEAHEGGFADRAFAAEPSARGAIERMLRDAVEIYTRRGRPQGCMVVSAATNYSSANDAVGEWLAQHRRKRTASIIARLKRAVASGELSKATDAESLGDFFATLLHGLSVQARDGVPKKRLVAFIPVAMQALELSSAGQN
jgi:hypothetical protein